MTINIGDTPQQLRQGLMFDGELWTQERINELQKRVNYLEANKIPDDYVMVPAAIWQETVQSEYDTKSAYHHLKKSISSVEICGVPLHHLSRDISNHMEVDTCDFDKQLKISALTKFRKQLKIQQNKNEPVDCPHDMVVGWKAGMCEVFSFLDKTVDDIQKSSLSDKKGETNKAGAVGIWD